MSEGNLHEVFSGIQGEGLYVGERQIFVRLSGCNLGCQYCDTASAQVEADVARVEKTAGHRDFVPVPNPIGTADLVEQIVHLDSTCPIHHSVSLTGGEPLVQTCFASDLARGLKESGLDVFLETNGTLPDALQLLIPFVTVISMDIKLPESTGGVDLLDVHEEFLGIATEADVYVKMVVTNANTASEISRAAEMMARIDRGIPLILQPVTAQSGVGSPSPAQVLDWQAQCRKHLRDVRVIPQCHKIIGQL